MIALHYHPRVTGAVVKRIRKALALTQREFAERLSVHKVTVAKWETGAQGIRGPAAKLIELLKTAILQAPARPKSKGRRGAARKRRGKAR